MVLILVLVYTGVKIWYGRLEERLRVAPVPQETAIVPESEQKTELLRKQDDYTIIVDRNIFQALITVVEKPPEQVQPEELVPTKLKLSLMGTVAGYERDARAIISDDVKRQQDIYQVGDTIQGAMIKAIERGSVILQVNGVDEILSLRDREGGGPAYEPSPSDFYQEPVEVEVPDTPEPPEQPEQPEQQEQVVEPGQSPEQPVVRPRPRRPVRMPTRARPSNQPGIDERMLPDSGNPEEKSEYGERVQ